MDDFLEVNLKNRVHAYMETPIVQLNEAHKIKTN